MYFGVGKLRPWPSFLANNIEISSTNGQDRAPDIPKTSDTWSFVGLQKAHKWQKYVEDF